MRNRYAISLDFLRFLCDNACMKIKKRIIIQIVTSIISPLLGVDFLVEICETLSQLFNTKKGNTNMYTKNQTAKLLAAAPITRDVAETFASEFGVSVRSVISKAVMLKIYQKADTRALSAKPTRADLIQDIEERLRLPHGELNGLRNASASGLSLLLTSILELEELS